MKNRTKTAAGRKGAAGNQVELELPESSWLHVRAMAKRDGITVDKFLSGLVDKEHARLLGQKGGAKEVTGGAVLTVTLSPKLSRLLEAASERTGIPLDWILNDSLTHDAEAYLNDGTGYREDSHEVWLRQRNKPVPIRVVKGPPANIVNLKLTAHTWKEIRDCAKREGTTIDALISECLDETDAFSKELFPSRSFPSQQEAR